MPELPHRQAARVFGEGLRGDSNGLHFEAGLFIGGFCLAQEFQCVLSLLFIVGTVQAHKRSDRADIWARRHFKRARGKWASKKSRKRHDDYARDYF